MCRDLGVALRDVSRYDLNLLSNDRPHQGLLLDCSALEWVKMEKLPEAHTVIQTPPMSEDDGSNSKES